MLIGEELITIADLVRVARDGERVELSPESLEKAAAARGLIEQWIAGGEIIYGVTTGFGSLCDRTITGDDARLLQTNLLMSHAAGVGPPFPDEVVRGMMAVRLKDLAGGNSGLRPETLTSLADLLNSGIIPVVPEKGSVGASGDLCPMAHLALVLIGLGEAYFQGELLSGAEALSRAGLSPVRLEAAEGIGLINGTQAMSALGALVVHDAQSLAKAADIACAMSLEVLMGTNTEFDPRIHRLRPHPGQTATAANLDRLTAESEIISSHEDCGRVQDAYTLRCSPQIHGASKDALNHVAGIVEIELNSTTTNPLIFPESGEFILGGNFHGQPLALAADYLSMALAELANVSERRVERLVNPQLSGLPAFLVAESGLNSGLMIAQYTAAALVSENKTLAHPACVDSIPTSANKEDHVSMGTISARQAAQILENATQVLAIELLCGAQAMDLLTKGRPGKGVEQAYRVVRERVTRLDKDRVLAKDIEKVAELVKDGSLVTEVEKAVGRLD
jgi:histidine ammonia-lyase